MGFGPLPDGSWDIEIRRKLEKVGDWLHINGEGIYGTRCFDVYKEGNDVSYTQTKDGKYVYAIVLNWQDSMAAIHLNSVKAKSGSEIKMLGLQHSFKYRQDDKSLIIEVPSWFKDHAKRPCEFAYIFKIEPAV